MRSNSRSSGSRSTRTITAAQGVAANILPQVAEKCMWTGVCVISKLYSNVLVEEHQH